MTRQVNSTRANLHNGHECLIVPIVCEWTGASAVGAFYFFTIGCSLEWGCIDERKSEFGFYFIDFDWVVHVLFVYLHSHSLHCQQREGNRIVPFKMERDVVAVIRCDASTNTFFPCNGVADALRIRWRTCSDNLIEIGMPWSSSCMCLYNSNCIDTVFGNQRIQQFIWDSNVSTEQCMLEKIPKCSRVHSSHSFGIR